jgi:hypothetical protein
VILLAAGSVLAQDKPTEVKFRKGSILSFADQVKQSDVYLARMKKIQARMDSLSKEAKTDKDIIKLQCLSDKKRRTVGVIVTANQFRKALAQPQIRGDAGARNHEFSKLTISYQKVVVLGQEAEGCIGEDIAYVGKTQVELAIADSITTEDPTVELPPELPTINPPVASPDQ